MLVLSHGMKKSGQGILHGMERSGTDDGSGDLGEHQNLVLEGPEDDTVITRIEITRNPIKGFI